MITEKAQKEINHLMSRFQNDQIKKEIESLLIYSVLKGYTVNAYSPTVFVDEPHHIFLSKDIFFSKFFSKDDDIMNDLLVLTILIYKNDICLMEAKFTKENYKLVLEKSKIDLFFHEIAEKL